MVTYKQFMATYKQLMKKIVISNHEKLMKNL